MPHYLSSSYSDPTWSSDIEPQIPETVNIYLSNFFPLYSSYWIISTELSSSSRILIFVNSFFFEAQPVNFYFRHFIFHYEILFLKIISISLLNFLLSLFMTSIIFISLSRAMITIVKSLSLIWTFGFPQVRSPLIAFSLESRSYFPGSSYGECHWLSFLILWTLHYGDLILLWVSKEFSIFVVARI